MSSRWKCWNTRRRNSSSTFCPIRPERCRKKIRLTAWITTTAHSTPTTTSSVCAEPLAVLLVLPCATALGAVVQLVIGGQQVAILRNLRQKLCVRADVRDGAVL